MTFLASGSARTIVPRASRMNLLVRLIMPWRLPMACALTLPVAVILNRFLAEDLVFILGILLSLLVGGADCAELVSGLTRAWKSKQNRHGMPCRAVRNAALY